MLTKIFYTFKDPFGSKYKLLINGIEIVIFKQTKNPKALTYYSQAIDFIYGNLEDYNPMKSVISLSWSN